MQKIIKLISFIVLVAFFCNPFPVLAQSAGATAVLKDARGNVVGNVQLTQTTAGVRIQAEIENFQSIVTGSSRGQHGFHIHAVGQCDPPFTSAGGHFNPTKVAHGLLDPDGPHAGDLVNLWVEADGTGDYDVTTDLVSLEAGNRSLFDADGSAIVIHQGADDYITDPAGDSGSRVACGVIVNQ